MIFSTSVVSDIRKQNPMLRDDPGIANADADLGRLSTTMTKHKVGTKTTRFLQIDFEYDAERNCYWCLAVEALTDGHFASKTENGRPRTRYRSKADATAFGVCPLAERGSRKSSQPRQIGREQNEAARVAHAEKMSSEGSEKMHSHRRPLGERPFATIKSQFGVGASRRELCGESATNGTDQ